MRTVAWDEDRVLVIRRASRGRPATVLLVEPGSASYRELLDRSEDLPPATGDAD